MVFFFHFFPEAFFNQVEACYKYGFPNPFFLEQDGNTAKHVQGAADSKGQKRRVFEDAPLRRNPNKFRLTWLNWLILWWWCGNVGITLTPSRSGAVWHFCDIPRLAWELCQGLCQPKRRLELKPQLTMELECWRMIREIQDRYASLLSHKASWVM